MLGGGRLDVVVAVVVAVVTHDLVPELCNGKGMCVRRVGNQGIEFWRELWHDFVNRAVAYKAGLTGLNKAHMGRDGDGAIDRVDASVGWLIWR